MRRWKQKQDPLDLIALRTKVPHFWEPESDFTLSGMKKEATMRDSTKESEGTTVWLIS